MDVQALRKDLLRAAAAPDHLDAYLFALEAIGFEAKITQNGMLGWVGPVPRCLIADGHTVAKGMIVRFREGWPYLPPLLEVAGVATWHANQERLCLWREGDATRQWATIEGLYERIETWSASAKAAFAGAPASLSPEVYWEGGQGDGLFGLIDVSEFVSGGERCEDGRTGRFTFQNRRDLRIASGRYSDLYEITLGKFGAADLPDGVKKSGEVVGRFFYRDRDVRLRPPTNWAEFLACLTSDQRCRAERDLNDKARLQVALMLMWDTGDGTAAIMLLHVRSDHEANWRRRIVVLRPSGQQALLLRAGPDATKLQHCSAVVLGVGAIGSFTVDLLARSGIRELRLVDPDIIWPVNRVRFAAPFSPVGMPKTILMKMQLQENCPWSMVHTNGAEPWQIDEIAALAEGADLVIDATGDIGHAELTARACQSVAKPFVSVALFRGGTVARVQRQRQGDTLIWDRTHLDAYPDIPPLSDELEYAGLETGCLAPVHNAPPVAVVRAATLAAEVAIDLLTGVCAEPDDIIDVIRPSGSGFQRRGRAAPEDFPTNVHLTESARTEILAASDAASPDEIGGVLFGLFDGDQPIIVRADAMPGTDPSPHRFQLSAAAVSDALASARQEDSRLGYLGSWHSHPAGDANPSATDLATFTLVTAQPETGTPVFLVVAGPTRVGERIVAFRMTHTGALHAKLHRAGDLRPSE